MTYSADIDALGADVRYKLSADANDSIGLLHGTNSGGIFTANLLCEDTTGSYETSGINDRIVLPTSVLINDSAQSRKIVCGWFSTTGIQNPPKNIYGDGGTNQAFRFILGWGNNLVFEVFSADFTLQVFGDTPLEIDRSYHLTLVFEGSGYGNEVKAYLDGVKQLNAEPTNRQPNVTTLPARTVGEFGDPAGAVSVGGVAVVLLAPINGQYAQWAIFDSVTLTDTQVREELFEKGALPHVTISDQAGLDTLANTLRPNVPCCIRVTGSNLNLTADNVTFDPLASIHVQWVGTGYLNWTNINGSNASICTTTGGNPDVTFINPTTLTINGIINGAEVRIYDDETANGGNMDTELDGVESNIGTSFVFSHNGAVNDIVIQMISIGYEEIIHRFTIGSIDQTLILLPSIERNA